MSSKPAKTPPVEAVKPKTSEVFKTSDVLTGEPKRPLVDSVRETLALVSAGAGLFVVLFYLAGRWYANGYFGAMNIPIYLLTFSLWEYGEAGGTGVFLGVFGIVAVLSLILWLVFSFDGWLSAKRFGKKDEHKEKIKSPPSNLPESSKEVRLSFQIFIFTGTCFAGFFVFAYLLTFVVTPFGKNSGQDAVLEKAAKVELISAIPLALDDNTLTTTKASGQDYYIYKGFYLLTFNGGKYYLFKAIDPVTCKPLKVYIINAEKDIQINLSDAESLSAQCQITQASTVTPTPSKVQPTATIQATPTP